jgi:hypothetical protein
MIKMKMLRKLLVSFFLALLLLVAVFVPAVKAQDEPGPWYNQTFDQWAVKVFDPDNPQEIFGERYTYAQIVWIMHSMQAYGMGEDLIACMTYKTEATKLHECIEAIDTTASLGPIPSLAFIGDIMLNTPPSSGIEYVANAASNLHVIPRAYAQGIGFEGLTTVQVAWRIARNAAYFLLIIATIVMAFMIMFRTRISPQVVITVQSALPRLVIILVLVTFSYAIAGFIIDIGYLVVGALAGLIKSVGVGITNLNPLELFEQLMFGHLFIGIALTILVWAVLLAFGVVGAGLIAVWAGGISLPASIAIGVLVLLVIIIVLLVTVIRIWWLILKTLINIVLLTIVAPIQILLGVFPGGGGFGSWAKNLAANVAVFPAIKIMFFLAHFFYYGLLATEDSWLAGIGLFNPLEINSVGAGSTKALMPGFVPVGFQGVIGWILAFGIVLMIPSVGNMIKSAIEGKPFAYGSAIGMAIGPVVGLGQRAWGATPVREYREMAGLQTAAKWAPRAVGFLEKRGGREWKAARSTAKAVKDRWLARKAGGEG